MLEKKQTKKNKKNSFVADYGVMSFEKAEASALGCYAKTENADGSLGTNVQRHFE